ncbi:MAG TPA: GntR family transcriptional regulator [Bacteroidales bacterium]|nr:GntR family transcriptional regulator [Bacteroidales bacterium]
MKNVMPLHRQIYEVLRKRIIDGTYEEGTLLPSENELCTIHGATRPTVRKALDALLNEGYIKKQQGKGSIVKGLPKGVGILSFAGTTSAIGKENLKTYVIVKPRVQKWDRAFTFELNAKEKEVGCIYMERLRLINDKPVFFDTTMIPNINLPRFTSRNFEDRSLFDILRRQYQLQVKGGEQEIAAIKANPTIQEYFKVSADHPILQLNRKMETNRLDFFFYSQVLCNTEDFALFGTF